MEYIILITVVFIALIIGIYYFTENEEIQSNDELEINTTTSDELKEPLSEIMYQTQNIYNNKKQDSRNKDIINILKKIHFWAAIIGIYFLTKAIITIIFFITNGALILDFLNKITTLLI